LKEFGNQKKHFESLRRKKTCTDLRFLVKFSQMNGYKIEISTKFS